MDTGSQGSGFDAGLKTRKFTAYFWCKTSAVIPAKAGIYFDLFLKPNMDSRFRGNDVVGADVLLKL